MKPLFFSILIFFHLVCPSVWAQEEVPAPAANFDPVQILLAEAWTYKEGGDWAEARDRLEQVLTDYPDDPRIDEAKKEWGEVIMGVIHSSAPAPEVVIHQVNKNDTLGKIARTYGTTVELIKIRNKLTSNLIRDGQRLSIWAAPFSIYVNKTTNHLSLDLDGKAVKIYLVSTGKSDTTTPVGSFVIKDRYPDPTWFHHGDIVPPGSEKNFLGTRWLGFDKPKYGIHGTIYPELIGQSVSGGCVRMKNEDVEELYDMVPVNTKVTIE